MKNIWIMGLLFIAACNGKFEWPPQVEKTMPTEEDMRECRAERDSFREQYVRLANRPAQPPALDALREPYAQFVCLTQLSGEAEGHYDLRWDKDPSLALAYLDGRSRAILNQHPDLAAPCLKAPPERPVATHLPAASNPKLDSVQ